MNISAEYCGMDYYGKDVAPTVLNCFGKSYPLSSGYFHTQKTFCGFFSRHEAEKPSKLLNPPQWGCESAPGRI